MGRKLEKLISLILVVAVLSVMSQFAAQKVYAVQLTDLDQCASYAREAVDYLVNNGIIDGSNGKFSPTEPITRVQLVKLLVQSRGIDISNPPAKQSFKDVSPSDWSYGYVEAALREGIIVMSSNGMFYPNVQTTREQMATMFVRSLKITSEQLFLNQSLKNAMQFSDSRAISDWAIDSVEFSLDNQLMLGVGGNNFSPNGTAERQQAAVVLYRFIMAQNSLSQAIAGYNQDAAYPEYYQAVKKALENGRYNASLSMDVQGKDLGSSVAYSELFYTDLNLTGFVNGSNSQMDAASNVAMQGQGEVVQNYSVTKYNGQYYYRESDTDPWSVKTESQLYDLGLPAISLSNLQASRQGILRDLNHQIINHETVTVDGQTLDHYSISMNQDMLGYMDIKSIGDFLGTGGARLNDAYNNGFSLTYNIYVNQNGDIENETLSFTGDDQDQASLLDALTQLDIDITYSDQGVVIPVAPPT